MRKRAHVFYSGRVQGVGFRYSAREVACGFEVTGFVRNLPDGRVELVAEGEEEEVKAFLEAIHGEPSGQSHPRRRCELGQSRRASSLGLRSGFER